MTLTELYSLLLTQADETSSSVPIATATTWFNEGLDDLTDALRLESSFSPSIVASTGEYSLPSDWYRLYRLRWGTDTVRETTLDTLIDDGEDLTDEGVPLKFYFWNSKIGFYPVPDSTVTTNPTVYYYRKPTQLSSSSPSAEPDMPKKYHTLLVDFAMVRYHQTQQEPDLELQANQRYQQGKRQLAGEVSRNKRGSYTTPRKVMGW